MLFGRVLCTVSPGPFSWLPPGPRKTTQRSGSWCLGTSWCELHGCSLRVFEKHCPHLVSSPFVSLFLSPVFACPSSFAIKRWLMRWTRSLRWTYSHFHVPLVNIRNWCDKPSPTVPWRTGKPAMNTSCQASNPNTIPLGISKTREFPTPTFHPNPFFCILIWRNREYTAYLLLLTIILILRF